MKTPASLLVVVLLATVSPVAAQEYEGKPCACGEQKVGKGHGFPGELGVGGYWSDSERNASSCLYAGRYKGERPASKSPSDDTAYDAWLEARQAYDRHTCKYSAYWVADDKPQTSWCEGMEGDGIGEVVARDLPGDATAVEIFAGFGKSKKQHGKNNRPKEIRLHILGIGGVGATQGAAFLGGLTKLAVVDATLRDEFGFQRVNLPQLNPDDPGAKMGFVVALEIRSVYRGSKYRDTCVAEIRPVK